MDDDPHTTHPPAARSTIRQSPSIDPSSTPDIRRGLGGPGGLRGERGQTGSQDYGDRSEHPRHDGTGDEHRFGYLHAAQHRCSDDDHRLYVDAFGYGDLLLGR